MMTILITILITILTALIEGAIALTEGTTALYRAFTGLSPEARLRAERTAVVAGVLLTILSGSAAPSGTVEFIAGAATMAPAVPVAEATPAAKAETTPATAPEVVPYTVDEAIALAIPLIKRFEGFKARAYYCPAGVLTIGYGTTNAVPGVTVTERSVVTRERADELLRVSLRETYAPAVARNVKVVLTNEQAAALISFVYNLGEKTFKDSTLLKRLNQGKYQGAYRVFAWYNKSDGQVLRGLTDRRALEAELFRNW